MIELGGTITTEGKLQIFRQNDLMAWIAANRDKQIVLSLKTKRKNRSNPQNSYYWGVIVQMITQRFNELGNEFTEEETHEFLKARFNAKQVEISDGHYIDVPGSTAKLDTTGFMNYMEKIYQFSAEMLGLVIPSPNEQTEISY